MNDDDLDPLHQLASAYLDDDITSADRVRVEASPELVGLVESFRQIRAGLGDVPAPPATTREAAFAAALLEFDGLSLGAAASMGSGSAAAPVVSLAERRRWPIAVLSVAAALLLAGVVGITALNGRGGDDKSSSATDAFNQQMAPSDAEAAEAADSATPMSTIGSITGGGAQVSMVIDTPEQLLALQAPSDVAFDLPPEATGAATADSTVADEGDSKRAASTFSSSPAISCLAPQQTFLADIRYRGVFGIAARDTVTGVTQAIAEDCTVLVSVGP